MKNQKRSHKKYRFTYIKTTLAALFLCLLFVEGYTPFEASGENWFHVTLNGQDVGTLGRSEAAEELLIQARRNIAAGSDELVFVEADLSVEAEEVLWGYTDDEKKVLKRMEEVLQDGIIKARQRSYSLKINNYLVNLASLDAVRELLQAAIGKYDSKGEFRVALMNDNAREFSVLSAGVERVPEEEKEEAKDYSMGGIASVLARPDAERIAASDPGIDDYYVGYSEILEMSFGQKVEIVETYLPENLLAPVEAAIEYVVMEQEMPGIYEVAQGDTLSEIAIKVDIPMDKIIEMNSDTLQDANSTLRIGQQLVITVPEPVLSVMRTEQNYYEEGYEAEVVVIDVDDWYTTQTEILQNPSAGFRKAVVNVDFVNDKEVTREVLMEEVVMEAVAKIMKRGTKIPPTYIWPISGGRATSSFGPRRAPKKGASTNHKGQDWAVPTGTPVRASCGGTVTKAGWGGGYGYVVYIDHEDGKQTRYAHLSRVLVSAGQKVQQGDRIALSGNTGVSTGPHLHFEILINGRAVNPMTYLK